MSNNNDKQPPQGDRTTGQQDSELVEEHRALINQDSVEAEDYPREQREAQSLVDKSKRRDQPD